MAATAVKKIYWKLASTCSSNLTRYSTRSRNAQFCDNFSTTQPITLNKISLESVGLSAVNSSEKYYLICISSGVICMEYITPLPFLLSVLHFSQLCSPWFVIRNKRFWGVISCQLWVFWVQTWPNHFSKMLVLSGVFNTRMLDTMNYVNQDYMHVSYANSCLLYALSNWQPIKKRLMFCLDMAQ
jgi:hypothetical protein